MLVSSQDMSCWQAGPLGWQVQGPEHCAGTGARLAGFCAMISAESCTKENRIPADVHGAMKALYAGDLLDMRLASNRCLLPESYACTNFI